MLFSTILDSVNTKRQGDGMNTKLDRVDAIQVDQFHPAVKGDLLPKWKCRVEAKVIRWTAKLWI